MSTYATLSVNTRYIEICKNYINIPLLSIYQKSDLRFTKMLLKDSPLEEKYHYLEPDEQVAILQCICTVDEAKDRLELMGYTLDVARKVFNSGVKKVIELYKKRIDNEEKYEEVSFVRRVNGNNNDILRMSEILKFLPTLTFDEWIEGYIKIQNEGLHLFDDNFSDYPVLMRYMLFEDYHGFPNNNIRVYLRVILELCEDNETLDYDFTDMVNSDDWDFQSDEMKRYLEDLIVSNYDASQRIIVLTEGKSDIWILERSLKLFCPHLSSYFRFLDFEGVNMEGGAGRLASTTKAFAGVGIVNKVIALFDNDTAAQEASELLRAIDLPKNIIYLHYPPIEIAKMYPTIGPTGIESMDINGLACSIELYLGEDCLRDEDGNLIPIQWKGYNRNLEKYQGEILKKSAVQKKFRQKLSACESNRALISNYDWSGVRLIINALCDAFQEKIERDILNEHDLTFH
ncbi:MAG: HEPN/Toprim-associated domain-containing protein [Pseudomonadota bacterium]